MLKTTRKYNEICKSLVKIVNMGQNEGQLQRIISNVHVDSSSELPFMRGLYKDHKKGRKYRPVVNGNVGPVSNLSEILSLILKGYMQELQQIVGSKDTIKSTEELLSHFESYNNSIKHDFECSKCDKIFIASMDVESLYPSLKAESTSNAIKQTILKSNISVEGVNYKELGILLRKNMSTNDIENSEFSEFIPLKRKKTKKTKATHEYDLWSFCDKEPDLGIIRQMFAECVYVASKLLMNNHIYEFGGNIHVQEGNGSIGVEFTGIAGEIYMLIWCAKFKEKLSNLNIVNQFQHRMVDDITILPSVILPGIRFESDKLVFDMSKVEEDKEVKADVRTMNIIQKVANSIDKDIKITYDVPSLHEDEYVPILDVKVKTIDNGKVEYIFYKKPTANRLSTLKSSAFSTKNKMTILTQECFRRLHNTSELVDDGVKAAILNEFMTDLKLSGYNEKEREDILIGGMNTYSNLKDKEKAGIRPFYRPYNEQNSNSKNSKVKNWFRKGQNSEQFKSVMFVDATPGDKLLKMLRHTESQFMVDENYRIKFVSKVGMKLGSILKSKNILDKTCSDMDGSPCVITDNKGIKNSKCKQNRVNYYAKCKTCDLKGKVRVYHGETARNLHVRSQEHCSALKNKCKNSFMNKHILNEHEGNPHDVEFVWGITGKYVKPLYRQLNEAISIENTPMEECLNSKQEYFHQNVKRIGLHNVENKIQCIHCSRKFDSENDLNKHEILVHTRYQCEDPSCDYKSFGEKDLKIHKTIAHNNSNQHA